MSFFSRFSSFAVDNAVAGAQNLPQLVGALQTVAPQLADSLVGKSLVASKSPWGTLAAGIVSYAASKYGFGWPPELSAAIGGAGVLLGGFVMRAMTRQPITSVLPAPKV